MRWLFFIPLSLVLLVAESGRLLHNHYDRWKTRLETVTCLNDETNQSCWRNVTEVPEGFDVSLICMNGLDIRSWCNMEKFDRPLFNVTWYKDGNLVNLTESCTIQQCRGLVLELEGRSLVLANVTAEMSGHYECHVTWYGDCCDLAVPLTLCEPRFVKVGHFNVTTQNASFAGAEVPNPYPWITSYVFFANLRTAPFVSASMLDADNYKSVYDWREPNNASYIWYWREADRRVTGDILAQHTIVHDGESVLAHCYLNAANPAVNIRWNFLTRRGFWKSLPEVGISQRRWSVYIPKVTRMNTRTQLNCSLTNGMLENWQQCRSDWRIRETPLCVSHAATSYDHYIEYVDKTRKNLLYWDNAWWEIPVENITVKFGAEKFKLCMDVGGIPRWGRMVASLYRMTQLSCVPSCPEKSWHFLKGVMINVKENMHRFKPCYSFESRFFRGDDIFVWRAYYAQWPKQVKYLRQRVVFGDPLVEAIVLLSDTTTIAQPENGTKMAPNPNVTDINGIDTEKIVPFEGKPLVEESVQTSGKAAMEEIIHSKEEAIYVLVPVLLVIFFGLAFYCKRQRCIPFCRNGFRHHMIRRVSLSLRKHPVWGPSTDSDSGMSSEYTFVPEISIMHENQFYISVVERTEYIIPLDTWEIPRERVEIGNVLGEGAFGQVSTGTLCSASRKSSIQVAIKMVQDESSEELMKDLLAELTMLKYISQDNGHVGVVRLYGCCTQESPVMLILEIAKYGDLRTYLQSRYPSSPHHYATQEPSEVLKLLQQLTDFAHQICQGMIYLSEIRVVHRDLAARNILVTDGLVLKIADFGMTRALRPDDHYYRPSRNGRVPVKWMPPEAINHGRFTTLSDVWAYGVVVWEIFTLGGTPYPTHRLVQLAQVLESGYRLPAPKLAPQAMYDLMRECWEYVANRRPTFDMIAEQIEASETFIAPDLPVWQRRTLEELEHVEAMSTPSDVAQYLSSV